MYRLSVITWFGMLFAICGYILSSYNMLSRQKWILFTAAANLLFFYLAYLKVYIYYPESTHNYLTKVAWSSASFAFAIFWSCIARNVFNKLVENKLMDKQILNISAVTATVFFTVGLLLAINSELYTIVFAAVLTIVSLLSTKIEKATLGQITLALLIAFSAAFVFQYKLNSYIFNARPVLYYAVPALLLGLSCRFFNKNIEEHYVSIVEIMTMLLLIKLGTTLIENTIVMYAKDITISKKYLLCGLNINFYLLLGATFTILIGKRYARKTFEIGGLALIAFAGIMILKSLVILLDITLSGASIGETPIFNALLLAYALPAFWLVLLNKQICQDSPRSSTEGLLQFCSSLLFFVWLTLCVRQYFHGGNLLAGAPSTSLEVYVYSIVWILLAIIMLILGAYYHSKQLRLLSLGLFIITIFKVFLFDAAELAGILRVLSFLGLGVSLIVISWFYARFIFSEHDENNLQK